MPLSRALTSEVEAGGRLGGAASEHFCVRVCGVRYQCSCVHCLCACVNATLSPITSWQFGWRKREKGKMKRNSRLIKMSNKTTLDYTHVRVCACACCSTYMFIGTPHPAEAHTVRHAFMDFFLPAGEPFFASASRIDDAHTSIRCAGDYDSTGQAVDSVRVHEVVLWKARKRHSGVQASRRGKKVGHRAELRHTNE